MLQCGRCMTGSIVQCWSVREGAADNGSHPIWEPGWFCRFLCRSTKSKVLKTPRWGAESILGAHHYDMIAMKASTLLVVANIILLVAVVVVMAFYKQTGSTSFTDTHPDVIDAQLNALCAETVSENNYPREWAVSQELDGSLWEAAAHLVIDPRAKYTATVSVLNWREDSNGTYVGDKIEHDAGSLTVKDGGYYFIYSQILYRGEGTRELEYGRVLHIVLKQRKSELSESPTPLMRNLISTPSIRRGHLTYASSVLGATFYLDSNTRLTVNSSVPGNIDATGSPHSNVFGLYLV